VLVVGLDDALDQAMTHDVLTAEADELHPVDLLEDVRHHDQPGLLVTRKVDPYLRPLYDALYDMMDADRLTSAMEKGTIEVAPLAFMRGRTLNDSFVILDEAQNTTPEQMKMFLTRLGFGSKMVITGDITQIDLPREQQSGLIVVADILEGLEGIDFVRFGGEDVVRHKLVQRIVEAYDEHAHSAAPELRSAKRRA